MYNEGEEKRDFNALDKFLLPAKKLKRPRDEDDYVSITTATEDGVMTESMVSQEENHFEDINYNHSI